MFMLVIGLNFMIAIIESTFSSVSDDKLSYLYRNKAEMNLEAFQILQYVPYLQDFTLQEFRGIIFTTFVDDTEDKQIVVHGRDEEIEDLLEKVENQMQKTFDVLKDQKTYAESLDGVIKNQLRIEKRINQEFDVFMGTVEEFRTSMMTKIGKLNRPRRFTINH